MESGWFMWLPNVNQRTDIGLGSPQERFSHSPFGAKDPVTPPPGPAYTPAARYEIGFVRVGRVRIPAVAGVIVVSRLSKRIG